MQVDRHFRNTDPDTLAEIAGAAAAAAVPRALRAGDHAPLFTLFDKRGVKVSLSALMASGPIVLTFLRGDWCTFGDSQLAEFQSFHARIAELGAAAMTIAPPSRPGQDAPAGELRQDQRDAPGNAAVPEEQGPCDARDRPDSQCLPELVDVNMRVARAFGLAFELPEPLRGAYLDLGYVPPRTKAGSFLVPIPATYLIDQDGVVVLAYVDVDYRNGMDFGSLLSGLQALRARSVAARRAATLATIEPRG
ncbi:redoxin domain-containing protein [Pararobbsia alpina]|uniref:redoxin domain-containing protein n=1 Tax=Pararobbsia alpina TaxID=621374 RepID=UPI0039A4D11D